MHNLGKRQHWTKGCLTWDGSDKTFEMVPEAAVRDRSGRLSKLIQRQRNDYDQAIRREKIWQA